MRYLRGAWYTLVWLLAWTKFSFHYVLVWELPGPGGVLLMSDEELEELIGRMKSGPMRFEYQRIEALKRRAKESFSK